jgi:hypothetical protein
LDDYESFMGKDVKGSDCGHLLRCCSGIYVELLKTSYRIVGVLANKVQTEHHRIQKKNVTAWGSFLGTLMLMETYLMIKFR